MTLLELYLPLALAGATLHGSPDATAWPTTTNPPAATAATSTTEPVATADPSATPGTPEPNPTVQRPTATRHAPTVTPTAFPPLAPLHQRSWTIDSGTRLMNHAVWQNHHPEPVYLHMPDVEILDVGGTVLRRVDNSRKAGLPLQPGSWYCQALDERPADLPTGSATIRLAGNGAARVMPMATELHPRYIATPSVKIERDEIERDGQDYHHRMRLLRLDSGTAAVSVLAVHFDSRAAFQFCTMGAAALVTDTPRDMTLTTNVDLRYSKGHETTFR